MMGNVVYLTTYASSSTDVMNTVICYSFCFVFRFMTCVICLFFLTKKKTKTKKKHNSYNLVLPVKPVGRAQQLKHFV